MDRRDISEKPRKSLALRAVACGTMVGIDLLLYIIISLNSDMIASGHASVKRGQVELMEASHSLALNLLNINPYKGIRYPREYVLDNTPIGYYTISYTP